MILIGKEVWAGLKNIFALTNRPDIPMQLRVSMEKFSNETATAYYDTFSLEDKVWFNYKYIDR
mgnify:CR=1 FL=1